MKYSFIRDHRGSFAVSLMSQALEGWVIVGSIPASVLKACNQVLLREIKAPIIRAKRFMAVLESMPS